MDADVTLIEAARSRMELLHHWDRSGFTNDIGPGVYDIHSPRVPSAEEMAELLHEAARVLRPEQLWVTPDCGLKTRAWPETEREPAQHGPGGEAAPRGARSRFVARNRRPRLCSLGSG